jgi:hypothetical protein
MVSRVSTSDIDIKYLKTCLDSLLYRFTEQDCFGQDLDVYSYLYQQCQQEMKQYVAGTNTYNHVHDDERSYENATHHDMYVLRLSNAHRAPYFLGFSTNARMPVLGY